MVTVAQNAVNWRNTHTHMDRTHSLIHLRQHSYNHVVQSANSATSEFAIKILFWCVIPKNISQRNDAF